MNKKKAIICSILFGIIIVGMFIGMFFIDINTDNSVRVWMVVSGLVMSSWIVNHIFKFYDWMMK